MTGVDDATLAEAAIHRGVQDYVVKGSINSSALDRSIRYACERKGLERELRCWHETLQERVKERTAELEQLVATLREEVATCKNAEITPDDQVIVMDQHGKIKRWQAQLATGIAAENAEGRTFDQVQQESRQKST
jgi:PleD family two-component response regulator